MRSVERATMRSHAEIPTPLCLTDQFQYIFHLILGSSLIPRELRLYMRFRQLGLQTVTHLVRLILTLVHIIA